MDELTKARILVSVYYDSNYSPTDDNIMNCFNWVLIVGISSVNIKQAIKEITGIIIG